MRYSSLFAPIACSLAIHVFVFNVGWDIHGSDAGISAPWLKPGLRVSLIPARNKVASILAPPLPAPVLVERSPYREKPAPVVPQAPLAHVAEPALDPQPAVELAPAELPDSAFMDPGGVDEMARPLVEPEYAAPRASHHWVIEFDLLIDATGKPVRVANVSGGGASREIIGAVLEGFFTVPYEPAKLAGQPVAIRQRFSVQPLMTAPGVVKLMGGPALKGGSALP